MGVQEYSPDQSAELENVLDELYRERARALDPDCGYQVKQEAWACIDGLLDVYNMIVSGK